MENGKREREMALEEAQKITGNMEQHEQDEKEKKTVKVLEDEIFR